MLDEHCSTVNAPQLVAGSDHTGPPIDMRDRVCILGVSVDNLNADEAMNRMRGMIDAPSSGRARTVMFANVHTLQLARPDIGFRECVNQSDLLLADGSGLKIAGHLLGTPFQENLNGTDLVPRILEEAERRGWSVFLVGSRENVLAACCAQLQQRYPALHLAGQRQGHFSANEEGEILTIINRAAPTILLVGMGSPKQEIWIHSHASHLNVRVCIAVGGLFDFLSGERPRAPHWMRAVGIEWMFRFWVDPAAKWQRVFVEIPIFLIRMIPETLRARRARPHFGKGSHPERDYAHA